MASTEKITEAITGFVRGGDKRDLELLDRVLHNDFRVISWGFMGNPGVTIIDKQKYLSNIREGIFGGLHREMIIENIDESGMIAVVKLRLESVQNYFVSYNSLVCDTNKEWKLINNLAVVERK